MIDPTGAFGIALGLGAIAAAAVGGRSLKESAAALSFVWLANLTVAKFTGTYDAWLFMAALDSVAAWFILAPPCSSARLSIGTLFIGQIVFHAVYGVMQLRGLEGSREAYLLALSVMGWLQIGALLVGAGNDYSKKRARDCGVHRRDSTATSQAFARDGGSK